MYRKLYPFILSVPVLAFTAEVTNTLDDSNPGSLRHAMENATPGETITFSNGIAAGTITLGAPLPAIENNLVIDGGTQNMTIKGTPATNSRAFTVISGTVQISDLTIDNCVAVGGAGGEGGFGGFPAPPLPSSGGGGGGLGAGGAVFINDNSNVVLIRVECIDNQSVGGTGGTSASVLFGQGGGGGGFGGAGMGSTTPISAGGGGGLILDAGTTGSGAADGGGNGGGIATSSGFPGQDFGGGGGGPLNFGDFTIGGDGGFAGGGGGGGLNTTGGLEPNNGGAGGFGAGGGGAGPNPISQAGMGMLAGNGGQPGNSIGGGGGGGSALGGTAFLRTGGTLVLEDCNISNTFSPTIQSGSGGTALIASSNGEDGLAIGDAIYLMDGTTLSLPVSTTSSINAEIAGDGSITKSGTGTLVLSGANTYSGGTTVLDGTLSGNFISLQGAINSAGTIRVVIDADTVVPGTVLITGSGSFTKAGAGKLTMDTPQIFTDTILVEQGTLEILDDTILPQASISSIDSGAILDVMISTQINRLQGNGTLNYNSSQLVLSNIMASDYAGVLTGSGSIAKIGSDQLIFSGALPNSFSGELTISEGQIVLNKTANTDAISGNVAISGGELIHEASEQIASSQSLTLNNGSWNLGANTETLNSFVFNGGSFTNTGALNLISSGIALQLRDVTTEGMIQLTSASPSEVIFDAGNGGMAHLMQVELGSADRTFNIENGPEEFDMMLTTGTSSGGGLIKTGDGTLLINGSVILTSATSKIQQGSIQIDGQFGSDMFMTMPGTILKGSGVVLSESMLDGIIQPGSSIGILTFIGNQIFGPNSVIELELNPNEGDFIHIVMGSVTIDPGSTVFFQPVPTVYPSDLTRVLVQTTNGVIGEFQNILNSFPAFEVNLQYPPNQVILGVQSIPLFELVSSGNAGQVAQYLDMQDPETGSDLDFVIGELQMEQSVEGIENALNMLHTAPFKGFSISAENSSIWIRNGITNQLRAYNYGQCLDDCRCFSLWGNVQGDFFNQGKLSDNIGFYNKAIYATVGGDYAFCHNIVAGLAASYSKSSLQWKDRQVKGHINGAYGSAYGSWACDWFALNAVITGGWNRYTSCRHIEYVMIDRRAKAKYNGWQVLAHLDGVGYLTKDRNSQIGVLASLDYIHLHQDRFKEKGANSINLRTNSTQYDLLRTEIGLIASKCSTFCKNQSIWIQPKLSYVRHDRFGGNKYKSEMMGAEGIFTVKGMQPDRNLIAGGFVMSWEPKRQMTTLMLNYNAEYGKKYWNQNIGLGLAF